MNSNKRGGQRSHVALIIVSARSSSIATFSILCTGDWNPLKSKFETYYNTNFHQSCTITSMISSIPLLIDLGVTQFYKRRILSWYLYIYLRKVMTSTRTPFKLALFSIKKPVSKWRSQSFLKFTESI